MITTFKCTINGNIYGARPALIGRAYVPAITVCNLGGINEQLSLYRELLYSPTIANQADALLSVNSTLTAVGNADYAGLGDLTSITSLIGNSSVFYHASATLVASSIITATGSNLYISAGNAFGSSTTSWLSNSHIFSIGIVPGSSIANCTDIIKVLAVGTAQGSSIANTTSQGSYAASVFGTSIVNGVGTSEFKTSGLTTGNSTASGISLDTYFSTGTALCTSTANGVSTEITTSTGTAFGTSTANGVGTSEFKTSGLTTGNSTASGISLDTYFSTGTAFGTSIAIAVSANIITGTAFGISIASGANVTVTNTSGLVIGTSSSIGTRQINTGIISSTSTANGVSITIINKSGSALGNSTCMSTGDIGIILGTSTANGTGVAGINTSCFATGNSTATTVPSIAAVVGIIQASSTAANSAVPNLPSIILPADNPSLPSWADIFTPQVGSYLSGTNLIGVTTKTGGPGDLLHFTGTFSSGTNYSIYGQTTSTNMKMSTLTEDGTNVGNVSGYPNGDLGQAIIPFNHIGNSFGIIWPFDNSGYGNPSVINQAELWWMPNTPSCIGVSGGSGLIAIGDTCRVMGAHLAFSYSQSSSLLTYGTGSQALTTGFGLNYTSGTRVWLWDMTNPRQYMFGTVTSYNSSTGVLVLNITTSNGTGTNNLWNINGDSSIYLQSGNVGGGISVTPTLVTPYHVEFTVPSLQPVGYSAKAYATSGPANGVTFTTTTTLNYPVGTTLGMFGTFNTTYQQPTFLSNAIVVSCSGTTLVVNITSTNTGIETTIAGSMNGLTLPQSTIQVNANATFNTSWPSSGSFYVVVSGTPVQITYTGRTYNSFTGCSGGSGTLSTGQIVYAVATATNWVICPSYQVWSHNGHGGVYGWSQTSLTVYNYPAIVYSPIYTVAISSYSSSTATALPAGTSTTSVAIVNSGNVSFQTQSGLGFASGMTIWAIDTTAASSTNLPYVNYMTGSFVSYTNNGDGTWQLVFNVSASQSLVGTGTSVSWDLTTDTTTPFNSAVTAAVAGNGPNGKITFSAGTYYFGSKPTNIVGGYGCGVWIQGAAQTSTFLRPLPTYSSSSFLSTSSPASKLSDLTVDCSNFIAGDISSPASIPIMVNVTVAGFYASSFTLTGTTSPVTAATYILGGMYNGQPYYVSTVIATPIYVWYNGVSSYIISETLGTDGSAYWSTEGVPNLGAGYGTGGSATGSPNIALQLQGYSGCSYAYNCNFVGGGSQTAVVSGHYFDTCNAYLGPDTEGAFTTTSSTTNFTLIHCTAQQNTGWQGGNSRGRIIVGYFAPSENILCFGNQSIALSPQHASDPNAGEQFLLGDGPIGAQMAYTTSATPNSVTFTGISHTHGYTYAGKQIYVAGGTGVGQYAMVLYDAWPTLTLDRNWSIIPDTTSLVAVTQSAMNIAIFNNVQQGTNFYDSGNTGVSFYEGGFNLFYDGNNVSAMPWGVSLWTSGGSGFFSFCASPMYWAQISNNTFANCLYTFRIVDSGPFPNCASSNSGTVGSTSSVVINTTGAKTFVMNADAQVFTVGQSVLAVSSGTIYGTVFSYAGGTLVITPISVTGSGTGTSWLIFGGKDESYTMIGVNCRNNIVASNLITGTSTSTISYGTGSKTWKTQSNLNFDAGNDDLDVRAIDQTTPGNYLSGYCTAYTNNGDGTWNVTLSIGTSVGSGSSSNWVIEQNAVGIYMASGGVLGIELFSFEGGSMSQVPFAITESTTYNNPNGSAPAFTIWNTTITGDSTPGAKYLTHSSIWDEHQIAVTVSGFVTNTTGIISGVSTATGVS